LICVIINREKFLCESIWGAGYINSDDQKIRLSYKPIHFLRPLIAPLNDHFLIGEESKQLIDVSFTYDEFLKIPKYDGYEIQLHSESHPLLYSQSENGLLHMQFSCLNPVESIVFSLHKYVGEKWIAQPDEIYTEFTMIQPSIPSSPNHCRFIVHLAFPSSGIFRISIFINGPGVWKSNIEVKQSCNHFMPFLHYPIDDSRFIPIVPKQLLSNVEDGIGAIRFVARKESSKVLMKHFCLEGEDWSDDNWNDGGK
jgi:hypothetical protein